jgi:hypothetical protein
VGQGRVGLLAPPCTALGFVNISFSSLKILSPNWPLAALKVSLNHHLISFAEFAFVFGDV